MTTPEMHVMFRQYAQQMGMQNVRAILPEQIDLLLNTSVMDITNQVIKENIGITNDRVITDNSKIGQINALRSLYHVCYIEMSPYSDNVTEKRTFSFSASDRNTGRMTTNFNRLTAVNSIPDYMFLVDFSLNYKKVENGQGYNGKNGISTIDTINVLTPDACVNSTIEYSIKNKDINETITVTVFTNDLGNSTDLHFKLDNSNTEEPKLKCTQSGYEDKYLAVNLLSSKYVLSTTFDKINVANPLVIKYGVKVSEYVPPVFESDGLETNYFPVRIIDDAYLADTLNDFVLKNRLRSPIIVTYNNDKSNVFDIYIDKFNKTSDGRYVLDGNLIPYILRMSYIGKPNKITYREDIGEPNDDCDLPEYMHIDIVKHAVDLYRAAISGALMAAKNQEQTARQENMRNNYRNEGNAQQ